MPLTRIDLDDISSRLRRPFLMEQVARVDHFAVYAYLCEGALARHRHLTQDELFYVYSGLLSLDTDWGRRVLSPRQFCVVPRGLAHASASIVRTVVVFFQAQGDPERQNGHGRLRADERPDGLPHWSVAQEVETLPEPYLPVHCVNVDEMSMRLVWCQGATPWHAHPQHDELLLVEDGRLDVCTEEGSVVLAPGQMVVVPRGHLHRLSSVQHTVVTSLIHGAVTPLEQMGREAC
jgi:mannose-6-phosphate isomerase-like protein (cupin superfamily)